MHDRNSERIKSQSPELADNDCNNQKDQNSNNGNCDHLIRSHPGNLLLALAPTVCQVIGPRNIHYLRAIPRNVFTLLSTYPSLLSKVS
jgi:hypothetical protein